MIRNLLLVFGLLIPSNPVAQQEDFPITPEPVENTDATKGGIDGPHKFDSKIVPGPEREYAVSVPAQYDAIND